MICVTKLTLSYSQAKNSSTKTMIMAFSRNMACLTKFWRLRAVFNFLVHKYFQNLAREAIFLTKTKIIIIFSGLKLCVGGIALPAWYKPRDWHHAGGHWTVVMLKGDIWQLETVFYNQVCVWGVIINLEIVQKLFRFGNFRSSNAKIVSSARSCLARLTLVRVVLDFVANNILHAAYAKS